MTNNFPDISIVTATRNRPSMLRNTLESIKSQTFKNFESIVVDDGSDADTMRTYDELWAGLDGRFLLHRPVAAGVRGTGPAAARNRGVQAARGEFIAFCDDDDRWKLADHLEVGLDLMRREGGDLYFTNMCGENGGRVTIPDWFPDSPRLTAGRRISESPVVHEVGLSDLASTMHHHYPHPDGCIMRASLIREVGGFWERVDIAEDVDLILRVADRARRIFYRPDCAVGYNVTPRDSAFTRQTNLEHYLEAVAVSHHLLVCCEDPGIRRCARSFDCWALRQLALEMEASRRSSSAALSLAWQALCVYPTPGALAFLAKLVAKRLSRLMSPRLQGMSRPVGLEERP